MSNSKGVRNRKSEMTSCWVCTAFVAIVYLVKNIFLGFELMGTVNIALMILFGIWAIISLFYTFQYRKWKKKNNM